jgi:hypothetical protein
MPLMVAKNNILLLLTIVKNVCRKTVKNKGNINSNSNSKYFIHDEGKFIFYKGSWQYFRIHIWHKKYIITHIFAYICIIQITIIHILSHLETFIVIPDRSKTNFKKKKKKNQKTQKKNKLPIFLPNAPLF